MSVNKAKIEKGTETYHKRCAREAALAVAKNWNPGLTLGQQQAAVYKVADAVYNNSPCYNDSVVGGAIAGLDVKKSHTSTQTGSKFNPIKITYTEVASKKTISYSSVSNRKFWSKHPSYLHSDYGLSWNPNYVLWSWIDVDSNSSYRNSVFDEIDENELSKNNYVLKHHDIHETALILQEGTTCGLYEGEYYPNDKVHSSSNGDNISTLVEGTSFNNDNLSLRRLYNTAHKLDGWGAWHYWSSSTTYKTRVAPSGTDPIKISVENDQIKVETDSHVVNNASTVAKAIPAQCKMLI